MRWANVAVAAAVTMVVLQASLNPLLPLRASAQDLNACNGVECGRGSCRVSPNQPFGFVCECELGWTQLRADEFLQFLPCIIPNCTFDYACINDSAVEPHPPFPATTPNFSLFDPCLWSYCGAGTCTRTSGFGHQCECKEGYTNLLNVTSFPCFRDCAVGADCMGLGLTLPTGYLPPSLPNFPHSNGPASSPPKILLWWLMLTYVAMI